MFFSKYETFRFKRYHRYPGKAFLKLFEGDHEKVKKLDMLIPEKMGFKSVFAVSGADLVQENLIQGF